MSECIIGGCNDTRPHLPAAVTHAGDTVAAASAGDYILLKAEDSHQSIISLSAWPCPSKAGQWGRQG